MLRNILKREFKVCIHKITQILLCADDRAETNDEFEIIYNYLEILIGYHINYKISQKDENRKTKQAANKSE
jgi:hypothetical protein